MNGTLLVSPEEMTKAASALSTQISNMDECFRQMKTTMQQTVSYWVGEAGEAHRKLYEKQIEKTQEIIARYNEHVKDLNAMAGVYSEAEMKATSLADELPTSTL